jgi:hypothetical protein
VKPLALMVILLAGCGSSPCMANLSLDSFGSQSAWSNNAAACSSSHTDAGGAISVSDGTAGGPSVVLLYGCNPAGSSACWTSISYDDGMTSWQTTNGAPVWVTRFSYGGEFAITFNSLGLTSDGGAGVLTGSISGPLE